MDIGTWQIVIVVGIIIYVIVRYIKKQSSTITKKIEKRIQKLSPQEEELEVEAFIDSHSKIFTDSQDPSPDNNFPSSDINLMSKVKRLKSLYNNGTLTKAEFEQAKNKLLK